MVVAIYVVNARSMQLQYTRIQYKALIGLVLLYDSKTVVWKEKEKSRIRAEQRQSLEACRFRRTYRMPKVQIRKLYEVTKGMDERINESIF